MAATIIFDTEQTLEQLLAEVHDGRLQVPEFQRKLSLEDDEWIKSLLASVSLGYPIGTVMLLQAGSTEVRFDSRPIAGAPAASTAPVRCLLDGQHRVTTLYQVLMSGRSVQIRGREDQPMPRWYSLDMNAAIDPRSDRDEAIISASDSGTEEMEWDQCRFPLRLVFGSGADLRRWKHGFVTHTAAGSRVREKLMGRVDADVLQTFARYVVPVVIVGKEHTRWSVRVHGGPDGRNLSDRFSTR